MTVLLIRANRNEVDERALNAVGIQTHIDPYLSISAFENPEGVANLRRALTRRSPTWLVVTSTNALPFLEQALQPGELNEMIQTNTSLMFAAIGAQTEQELLERGAERVLRAESSDSGALSELLLDKSPKCAVVPSGSIAMRGLTDQLRASGCEVIDEVVYTTSTVSFAPSSVEQVQSGEITGVVLRSPSAARAFVSYNGTADIEVFCAGQTTAAQARELGLLVSAISPSPEPEVVAETIRTYRERSHS